MTSGAFTAMAARFDNQAGAFASLLMILLDMPCVAAVGAICHQTGQWAGAAGILPGEGMRALHFRRPRQLRKGPVRRLLLHGVGRLPEVYEWVEEEGLALGA